MEVEQARLANPASMTFDEVSMERSKCFVKALQELKNLRPQLYSAAEYCENSYLHSEQKQMVLDNLKDYAVRALVNAVDHLGTVACKLTDVLEQQTSDVSTIELKASCLNQVHVVPKVMNGCFPSLLVSVQDSTFDLALNSRAIDCSVFNVGALASKTLSWHLASETKSTLKATQRAVMSTKEAKTSGTASGSFHLVDAEEGTRLKSSAVHPPLSSGVHASSASMQTFGARWKDSLEGSKHLTAFGSFDNPSHRDIVRVPARNSWDRATQVNGSD
ncbi:ABI-1-like 1 [Actinidia rufa]|uniref:ABI-1-like 1 n=1 Tax=Actinidia rufa TaxID=165716 RepID=A0A7J0F2P4_9ERIC|nr:ABI-1-like 1 [Actinidia rufa]